ncbi:DMT family transporter [Yoonia sp.]|uniref:DMT family transporter n=1 Tax=Yoonia sp. TaxID=2212373 RepID=UPI0025E60694|nr:DMT family transporter [Yoonia sp.]
MPHHILIMLAAGIGVPVLAALNAALGRQIGSPAVAASVLFVVAFGVAAATALLTNPQAIAKLPTAPRHLFSGGVLVAFYVLAITWIAPTMGVGNAVFLVLLGQLISAAAIDHFALFNAQNAPLTLTRAAGIALMAAGVFVTQRA